ncbi:MAG: GIY-YIG nuclease family protein [Solirubrobacteraceae bacterium]|nr:GIY-YIG nuclease family protein [Solirubrobacteraceae bacterium]
MPTPPLDFAGLPQTPGVYRFRDAAGRALYIGRAVDLRRRVRSYWGSQKGRPRMRRMVPQIVAVEVVECASEHEAAWLERNLLEQSKPRWNRARGGLETPVYLRLDPAPKAPSLTVVHDVLDELTHFGPYLGGTRVRTAVTALGFLYPLAYAGDGLTGAAQAMATARSVTPADHADLLQTVTAILARDPLAAAQARLSLETRRDRAAKALEFELAGRIQEQIEAVGWLASTQRVTVPEPLDANAAGWADGVLVEFAMKAGRIRTWKQSASTREAAMKKLAATPETWADFATRNAELAARISSLHVV